MGQSYSKEVKSFRKKSKKEANALGFLPNKRAVAHPLNRAPESTKAWLLDCYSRILRSYVIGPSGFLTMAPLRYTAKFDPFPSLDCAPTPSTLAQSKERKGSNFAIWQPWPRCLLSVS